MQSHFQALKHTGRKAVLGTAALLSLALAAGLTGCAGSNDVEARTTVTLDGEVVPEPTEKDIQKLLKLSAQRAELVCKGDWIQVYDFYNDSYREFTTLYTFLEGKSTHHYERPSKPLYVGFQEGRAFLEVDMFWHSSHPKIMEANPGGMPAELLEMVEVWEWDGREWGYRENERRGEFYQKNPGLLK